MRIFVAGHMGMVGSSVVKELMKDSSNDIILRSRSELDLCNQHSVNEFFKKTKIDTVYICAAKVGGIYANNTFPADFLYENLMIELNIIHSAHLHNVRKIILLGSSCIYPKHSPQPIKEEYLLTSELENTNEAYAIAKIAGIKMCHYYYKQHNRDFRSFMPTNLYGPNDNFHDKNSHVIPALISRFHNAKLDNNKKVTVWGSGNPRREFMHVDDLAEIIVKISNFDKETYHQFTKETAGIVNIGSGTDIKISDLVEIISKTVNFEGEILFDDSMPDGTPQKLMDVSIMRNLNLSPSISLESGLKMTYEWFIDNIKNIRQK